MQLLLHSEYFDTETLKFSAQLVSTLVGLTALFVSFRNENRNQLRFQQQLEFSKTIAEANVRPLLALTISAYEDRKAVELVNHGSGTAVIREIVFKRGEHVAGNIPDVLDLTYEVVWNDFTELDDTLEYLPAKGIDVLIELTHERLMDYDFSEEDASEALEELEKQLDEVKVIVTYDDVLGNVIAEAEQLN